MEQCSRLEHWLGVEKLVSVSVGVNYEEHAVFYSFAGRAGKLAEWFSGPDAQLPQNIADVPHWCGRVSAGLSQRSQTQDVRDNLWQTLKATGILKFDRKILHPSKFETKLEENGARIRAEIPKEDLHVFQTRKLALGRVAVIQNSECAQCGESYDECPHSKYFDEGVVHRITSLELLGVFWSEKNDKHD